MNVLSSQYYFFDVLSIQLGPFYPFWNIHLLTGFIAHGFVGTSLITVLISRKYDTDEVYNLPAL